MSEQEQDQPGAAVAAVEPLEKPGHELAVRTAGAELITDDEIRRVYRLAEAMAASGMFKDVKKAEQAFVKMVVGRDLGLTPMQSMQGLHVVEGGISMHYATLGYFIRARDGYDFRAGWLKVQPRIAVEGEAEAPPEVVVVWMDEEDPADLREVMGAVVVFTVNGEQRGVSRFTMADAEQAKLIKDKGAWKTSPRNMLLARSMSNGVKWFVPEVLGGLPVYTDGELEATRQSVTEPAAEGTDEGTGIDLGPKVDEVIARAEKLGHVGLSNRGALELALGNRSPAVINKWVRDANAELTKFEAEQAGGAEAAGEAEDAADDAQAEAVVEGEQGDEGAEQSLAEAEAEAGEPVVDADVVDEPNPNDEDAAKGLADPIPDKPKIPGPPNPPQADDDRPVA